METEGIMVALLCTMWVINALYCISKILEDWKGGKRETAALGLFIVVALNGLVVWLVYDGLTSGI